jgi:hypothetical protein
MSGFDLQEVNKIISQALEKTYQLNIKPVSVAE